MELLKIYFKMIKKSKNFKLLSKINFWSEKCRPPKGAARGPRPSEPPAPCYATGHN